jgi:hypothetical protein
VTLKDFTSFVTIGYRLSAENSVHKLATNLDIDATKLLRVNRDRRSAIDANVFSEHPSPSSERPFPTRPLIKES